MTQAPSTITLVLIRHGKRAYREDDRDIKGQYHHPRHDPDLVPGEEKRLAQVGQTIAAETGPPNVVWTSPYVRTRATAYALTDGLGVAVPVYTTPILAEYNGYRPREEKLEVAEDTGSVPREYNYTQLLKRLGQFPDLLTTEEPVVWAVSHRTVLQQLAKLLGVKTKALGEGEYVVLEVPRDQ